MGYSIVSGIWTTENVIHGLQYCKLYMDNGKCYTCVTVLYVVYGQREMLYMGYSKWYCKLVTESGIYWLR